MGSVSRQENEVVTRKSGTLKKSIQKHDDQKRVRISLILMCCWSVILPFILRWLVTENDLINYIETLPASRIKRDCRIIKWTLLFLNFLVFILCIYFYLNYIEGVVK